MRVLIVSPSYLPEIGAAPSRITNMAEGLSGLGIKVDVLTCLPNYPKGRIFDGYRGGFFQDRGCKRDNGLQVLDVCLDLEETVGPSCEYVFFRHDPLVFRSQA